MNDAKPAPSFTDFSDLDYLPGDTRNVPTDAEATKAGYLELQAVIAERTLKATNRQREEHACGRCGGTGIWHGGYGRFAGQCFACGGKGKILRAANYLKNKAARAERKQRQLEQQNAEAEAAQQRRIDAFKLSRPEIAAWLGANRERDQFAASLCQTVADYGNLSVGQEQAVLKIIGRATQQEPVEGELDVSPLSGYYAVPNGETRLKIRVHKAGKQSRWNGTIFVDDGAEYGSRQNYGRQSPGGLYRGRLVEQLKAILADPLAAQVAYGKLTGTCGHCGRKLEDEQSVAAGIGPICAGKVAAGLA